MVDFNPIFEEVDNLGRERVMELMRTLININTTVPPGNSYREYVDAISPYFKDLPPEILNHLSGRAYKRADEENEVV